MSGIDFRLTEHARRRCRVKPGTAARIFLAGVCIALSAQGADEERPWAFRPPTPGEPPIASSAGRVRNGIDAFILKELEARELTLAPEAPKRVLARRLYFDLISLPPMHKLMVTSSVYRQSSTRVDPRASGIDPDNRLLWRFNRRRLEAEAVRDAVLFVSFPIKPVAPHPQ